MKKKSNYFLLAVVSQLLLFAPAKAQQDSVTPATALQHYLHNGDTT
ncbi:MAG: hypothetical protein H0X41_10920, partial [Chitinophagaceae bacterium]|nr:hypothetical protein [Chitinophagaceae bacterium]